MRPFFHAHAARRMLPGLSAAALALLLAACIFAPGKFTSRLDLHKDRSFAFRYTGEILMIPLMEAAKKDVFEPETCYDEDSFNERKCTADELAQQKQAWESAREERKKSDAQAAQMLLGGIDPSNPESGREIADKLRRQTGWNKVEYLGNGKFDVDFAISAKLDHDFTFPTFEGMAMTNAFVQVSLRQDGTVRVDAPGFGPANRPGAMAGMMSGVAKDTSNDDGANLADGTFTIHTDAQILANNTDEGPASAPGGQSLSWQVNPRTPAAPTALLKLQP
jgi:hypothetical protein